MVRNNCQRLDLNHWRRQYGVSMQNPHAENSSNGTPINQHCLPTMRTRETFLNIALVKMWVLCCKAERQ